MATQVLNIPALVQLLEALPHIPERKRTLFDVLGIRDREYSISQVLAFFLDPNADHGCGDLFLNSLIQHIAQRKPDHGIDPSAQIEVETEWTTQRGRLDILILGRLTEQQRLERKEDEDHADWAILIENKVYAGDYNDLHDYWRSVKAIRKVGVLLALDDRTNSIPTDLRADFFALKHSALITSVSDSIGPYIADARHEHLLLLKEHISNINGFYAMEADKAKAQEHLKFYQEHVQEIDQLDQLYKQTGQYIIQTLNEVMASHGFERDRTSMEPTGRHFYPDPNKFSNGQFLKESFRLWVAVPEILRHGVLGMNLELHGKAVPHGPALREMLAADEVVTKDLGLKVGTNKLGAGHYHLVIIDQERLDPRVPLEKALRDLIESKLLNHAHSVVQLCFDKWLELHPNGL